MDLQGYGTSTIRGYVFRDGVTEEIVDGRFDYDFDEQLHHRDLRVELTDSGGRTTIAVLRPDADRTAQVQFPLNPRMSMVDVIGAAEIDGEAGAAYTEFAWNPDYFADRRAARSG